MLSHIQCLKGKGEHYPSLEEVKVRKFRLIPHHPLYKVRPRIKIHSFHQIIFFNLLWAGQHFGHRKTD